MTRKTTLTAASAAIAACQSRQHREHSAGGTTQASKNYRKVSHLQNVSTIYSVRKSRRLSEKRDNDKPDAKPSSRPEATVPPAAVPAVRKSSLPPPTSSTQPRPADTAETRRHREEEYPRGTKTTIRERIQVHSSPHTAVSTHTQQSLRVSDSPLESRNGTAVEYQQMKNSLSYQLRRVSCGSAILKKQYNRHIYMTLIKTTHRELDRCYPFLKNVPQNVPFF